MFLMDYVIYRRFLERKLCTLHKRYTLGFFLHLWLQNKLKESDLTDFSFDVTKRVSSANFKLFLNQNIITVTLLHFIRDSLF